MKILADRYINEVGYGHVFEYECDLLDGYRYGNGDGYGYGDGNGYGYGSGNGNYNYPHNLILKL